MPHRKPRRKLGQKKQQGMSLESAMDEERLAVLELLDPRQRDAPQPPRRTDSPAPPPVRSLLDVNGPPPPRHGSIAGIGVGATIPPNSRANAVRSPPPVRSMLDIRPTHSASTPSSPVETSFPRDEEPENSQRRASDTTITADTTNVKTGLPQIKPQLAEDVVQNYQFDILPSPSNHALPKRVSQGGKNLPPVNNNTNNNNAAAKSSMATVMSGGEFGPLPGLMPRGRDIGRHSPSTGHQRHSNSPSSRFSRSRSPNNKILNTNSFNPLPNPGEYYTDSGEVIKLDEAYKRLTSSVMSKSGGALGALYEKGTGGDGEPDTVLSESNVRLVKDLIPPQQLKPAEVKDVRGGMTSDDNNLPANTKTSKGKHPSSLDESVANEPKQIQEQKPYQVKSMIVESAPKKKCEVHPNTNFDDNTPAPSDDESGHPDLPVYLSPVDHTVPNRGIQTLIRGDFPQMEKEAEEGTRRLRKYLVATDLSDEALYALEWTIGTILRDGDTLYTVYAIDESASSAKGYDLDSSSPQSINDGAKAMQDAAEVIASQTETTAGNDSLAFSPDLTIRRGSQKADAVGTRQVPKGEADRQSAIERIKQNCLRLLRKTKLEVRVAIEVIHCKNPKHLILEAIDALEPTLVILGSRGMGSLKGVLLGSFSNYLVTKSSVPVMVARKRLHKHHKLKSQIRLANNVTWSDKRFQGVKIDELSR